MASSSRWRPIILEAINYSWGSCPNSKTLSTQGSSLSHPAACIPKKASLEDLDWQSRSFDGVVSYAMTKRFQVMMTELLSKSPWGKEIRFECMHPGWADTPAVQSSIPGFHKATKRILRSPLEGADTVIYLAAARDLPSDSGHFWFDRQPRDPYLLPRTRESHDVRRALWDFSFYQRRRAMSGVS